MEKDFNTGPDSMDLLLKQAYLKLDENQLSNQKLNDMLANSVLNNDEIISVNTEKEKELFQKINSNGKGGFLAANKLWIGLSILSLLGVFTFIYFYSANSQRNNQDPLTTLNDEHLSDPAPETNIVPILRDSVMPEKEFQTTLNTSTFTKTPVTPNTNEQSLQIESTLHQDPPDANNGTPIIEVVDKTSSDPDNIPVLTEDDKKKNKKRKEALVKSLLKSKPIEWIKINSTTSGIPAEYYLMTAEVTNIQYKTFLMDQIEQNKIENYKKARVKNSLWKEIGIPGFENVYFYNKKYDNNAVVNISPDGMKLYSDWLGELINDSKQNKTQTKYKLRLPTEQEWKYACTSKEIPDPIYTAGLNILINPRNCMLANYKPLPQNGEIVSNPLYRCDDSTKIVTGNSKYCTNLKDSTISYVVMVYAFNPSYRGLYCMAGNVSEVVTKDNGNYRSIGGNWNSTATYLKMKAPDEFEGKSLQNPFVGFRVLYTKE